MEIRDAKVAAFRSGAERHTSAEIGGNSGRDTSDQRLSIFRRTSVWDFHIGALTTEVQAVRR